MLHYISGAVEAPCIHVSINEVADPEGADFAVESSKNETRVTSSMQPIDLTLTAYHGMRGVEITPKTRIQAEGFNTSTYHLYSHAGTHMDAPLHFVAGGRTIDHLALEKCIGPALVVDLSHLPPNSLITLDDLGDAAASIGAGSRVLLRTDWSDHAALEDYRTHFPRISLPLANWFAAQGIWLIGLETPSVASLLDKEELTTVHQALLNAEIVIVESLANLRLLEREITFIALPLKIDGGDGSPVRAVALQG